MIRQIFDKIRSFFIKDIQLKNEELSDIILKLNDEILKLNDDFREMTIDTHDKQVIYEAKLKEISNLNKVIQILNHL